MNRMPSPGDFYKHFKDKMYQVIALAVHSETREKMVVYQALYGTFGVYVRPLSMFLSEVDHEKYPDVLQRYRFEYVNPDQLPSEKKERFSQPKEDEEEVDNKNLLAFLDARSYHDKLEILKQRKGLFKKEELLALCEIMEIGNEDTLPEDLYDSLEGYLKLQIKYDGTRLR
ncbi:DUF1653 domain-containing protein [Clostridium sp. E02]|uniref:DUF1653 domain-containing protein n=1 Tax=Clostridium sp. E02 TaxID=2487134 RepID=UPI000F52AFFA|nr:DUF1653 domain-containing protein [Clostridium sp. E02]